VSTIKLSELKKTIRKNANQEHAKNLQWFFKTGKGEYGEGDKFLGLKVPLQRKIANQFSDIELSDLKQLLQSKIHEDRLISLLILVDKYQKADDYEKEKVYKFYLQNRQHINNWDLVDLSAPKIVGQHLLDREKEILYKYARSTKLWEKRIAILSTATFIKNEEFTTT
jgi:3-methyladenine DNA glycosylase AlkD